MIIINIHSFIRCDLYVHSLAQDHNYLGTKRSVSLAKELDRLRHSHPEQDDLFRYYARTKYIATRHEEMLARGQILSLKKLQLNPVLF